MIKKFKELGHSASFEQKLVILVAIGLFNLGCYYITDFAMYGKSSFMILASIPIWWFVVIPISLTLAYHLFPKKD